MGYARYVKESSSVRPGPPRRGPGHRWNVLGVGVAANACVSAAFQGIPTTAVFMRSDYHLALPQLGFILGLLGLGLAFSDLPWGLLTDRWGDRRVLLTGLAGTAVALAAMALFLAPTSARVPSIAELAVGLLAVGLLAGSVNGSSGRAVMTWFSAGDRGLAMSIRQTAVPLGGGTGALILPSLAARFGFVAVYGVLAALCAVTAYFTWCWLHEPPVQAESAAAQPVGPQPAVAPARAARGPLRDAQIWKIVFAIAILCVPQFAVLTFATVFLHDARHLGVAGITATLVTVQLGAMAARVWSGRWTDRRGNRREYLQACCMLSVAAFAALGLLVALTPQGGAGTTAAIVALLIVAGIFVSAWHGVAFAELATLAGATRVGTAFGMANSTTFLSLFVTPLSIPAVLLLGSWPAVWLMASACALIALPLFPRPLRRPAAASQAPATSRASS